MKLALSAFVALFALASAAQAADTCKVKAVIAGKAVTLSHCAVAVMDSQGLTLFFSETPIGAEEREAFEFNSYAKSTDPSGKERTMMHAAFCPGGGASVVDATKIQSVELSLNRADSPLAFRQWVFELPKDRADLQFERLTGSLEPGGRFAGRITGGKTSDGQKFSWEAEFDLTLPTRNAAAGPGCGG